MAPHSSTPAWKIPWMEEPGRLLSMGSLWVRQHWTTSLSFFTFMHWRRKWQPIQYFCLENPRDRWAWWAAIYGVAQSRTWLKWLSSGSSSRPGWALKNWCFWTVMLEKTLESPLDCKEIQPVHPKGDQSLRNCNSKPQGDTTSYWLQ